MDDNSNLDFTINGNVISCKLPNGFIKNLTLKFEEIETKFLKGKSLRPPTTTKEFYVMDNDKEYYIEELELSDEELV